MKIFKTSSSVLTGVIPGKGRECEKWLWAEGLGKHAVLENWPGEEFHKALRSYIAGDTE